MHGADSPTAADLLQHTQFVRAMARGVLGADDLVDDAVQDTWLAALRVGPRRPERLRSWLGSVARRRAQDIHRRRAVQQRHERARPEPRPAQVDASELDARARIGRELVDALLALDPKYREILLLRYYDDLPPREISARLGMPVETVRTRARRGLARLRDDMTARHDGDGRAWAGVLASWVLPAASAPAATSLLASLVVAALLVGLVALFVIRPWSSDSDSQTGAGTQSALGDPPAAGEGPKLSGRLDGDGGGVGGRAAKAPPASGGSRFTVSGHVRDEGGHAVVGIPVRYSFNVPRAPGEARTPEGSRLSEAFTDETGRYVIKDLLKGKLWLSLLSEMNFGPSPEIEHQLEGDWSHDFTIAGSLLFSGRVEAPGAGDIDVWLDFREEQAGGAWGNVWAVRKARLTGPDKRFRFIAMRPGVYALHASGAGLAHEEERLELFGDKVGHVVRLHSAFTVSGRVEVAEGLAVGGSTLWARRLPSGGQWRVPCASDGTFELKGIVPGRYELFARNATGREEGSYVVLTERTIEVALEGDRTPVEIRMERDEEVGLDVQLPEGISYARGWAYVLDSPAGKKHAIDVVVSRKKDGACETSAAGGGMAFPPIRDATKDGLLRLSGMPKGSYRVRVELSGFDPAEKKLHVDGPTTVSLDVVKSRGRLIKADLGRSLYYRIHVRSLDDPDAVWREILWMDARVQISHTATPGIFEAMLKAGTYEFRIQSLEHGETRVEPVTLEEAEEPYVLRPTLSTGAAISGRVVAGRDARDTDLLLHVFRQVAGGAWEALEIKQTDALDGEYRIRGLEPGTYRISGSTSGEPALAEVEMGESDVEQHLRLGAAAKVKELPPRKPRDPEPEAPDDP